MASNQVINRIHTLDDLSEYVMQAVFGYFNLKQLVCMTRVNQSFADYSVYHFIRCHEVKSGDIPSSGPYLDICLQMPNLLSIDSSKTVQTRMTLDEVKSMGQRLSESCPNVKEFKNLGILGVIMVSEYIIQLVTNNQEVHITCLELFPGVMNENYTISELRIPFIESLKMIDKHALKLSKLTIEGSYEWSQEMVNHPALIKSLGSDRLKSVKMNYQMIYDSLCLSRRLESLDSSFALRDSDLNYLNVNHPNLQSVKIKCPHDEMTFVNSLALLNKLQVIELRQLTSGLIDYKKVFEEFLTIRGGGLKELSLTHVYVDLSGVWSLLNRLCPNLRVLKVKRYWAEEKDQNEIVECLNGLTNLRHIELEDFVFRGFTKAEIKRLTDSLAKLSYFKYNIKSSGSQKSEKPIKLFSKEIQLLNQDRRHKIRVEVE